MAGVRIRRATPADVPAIAAVQVAAWRWAYAHLFPRSFLDGLSEADRAERWMSPVSHPPPGFRAIVATDAGSVVGFASYGPPRDGSIGADTGELYTMYVAPERVATGVGRTLMDRVLDDLRGDGARAAILWVFADNPRSRRFYERTGWRPDGASKSEMIGPTAPEQVRYRIGLDGQPLGPISRRAR